MNRSKALSSLSIHWGNIIFLWKQSTTHNLFLLSTFHIFCVSPPHCCRARVSCPPPWCGAFGTGTGGCPWWCPCGWSSPCRRASSSGERWETARFPLRNKSTETFTNTTQHTHTIYSSTNRRQKLISALRQRSRGRGPEISCKEAARKDLIVESFQCSLIGGSI